MQPMLRLFGFILKNDVDDDDVDDVIEAHPVSAQSTSIKLKHSYLTDEQAMWRKKRAQLTHTNVRVVVEFHFLSRK